jgi:hypothetical protein
MHEVSATDLCHGFSNYGTRTNTRKPPICHGYAALLISKCNEDRQCTYNVMLGRIRATIVEVEKQ